MLSGLRQKNSATSGSHLATKCSGRRVSELANYTAALRGDIESLVTCANQLSKRNDEEMWHITCRVTSCKGQCTFGTPDSEGR